jgi:hypothetical protein
MFDDLINTAFDTIAGLFSEPAIVFSVKKQQNIDIVGLFEDKEYLYEDGMSIVPSRQLTFETEIEYKKDICEQDKLTYKNKTYLITHIEERKTLKLRLQDAHSR